MYDYQNDSAKSEGATASENMSGGIVSEFHSRISANEKRVAELHARLDAAEKGDVGLDAVHVNHVMQKHFFHDRPDVDDPSKLGSG